MDDLPPPILAEILRRLRDSSAVASCRVASSSLNAAARDVRSIHLTCTLARYLRSRSFPAANAPFKDLFWRLVSAAAPGSVDDVSVGVDRSLGSMTYDDVEDDSGDDLHLTDARFLMEWLPSVNSQLRSLSVSDFWIQSCWRQSFALAVVSSLCRSLVELELKNAWLSVEALVPMPTLTSLTLEFIRLDDEDLSKVNHCFPSLRVLNLIGVGGLKEPTIQLQHLQACRWTVSNAPLSLTIRAPNLVKLELQCIRPRSVVLDVPLLSDLRLSIEKADSLEIKEFVGLKCLCLESPNLCSLIRSFPPAIVVRSLTVDALKCTGPVEMTMLSFEALIHSFPKVSCLTLRSGAWADMETCFLVAGLQNRRGFSALKELNAQLVIHDVDVTLPFIFSLLDKCPNLANVGLLVPSELDPSVASKLFSSCIENRPLVRWRWGNWSEGSEDCWMYDGFE